MIHTMWHYASHDANGRPSVALAILFSIAGIAAFAWLGWQLAMYYSDWVERRGRLIDEQARYRLNDTQSCTRILDRQPWPPRGFVQEDDKPSFEGTGKPKWRNGTGRRDNDA